MFRSAFRLLTGQIVKAAKGLAVIEVLTLVLCQFGGFKLSGPKEAELHLSEERVVRLDQVPLGSRVSLGA
jgi:hypothetical protein